MVQILILLCLAGTARAEFSFDYKKSGSFYYFENIPKALFFFDPIETGDSFAFRDAIRKYDIEVVVLSSPGGSVYEGLQLSGIISDNGISTIIPAGANCSSACSFMFFAGKQRLALREGLLGVHQFTSGAASANNQSQSETSLQYTVGDIISYLNFYDTPPFVYEAMFRTLPSEMYFFTNEEKNIINNTDEQHLVRAALVSVFLDRLVQHMEQRNNSNEVRLFNWPHLSEFIPKRITWSKDKDYAKGLHCYDPDRKIVFRHAPFSMTSCGGKSFPISRSDYLKVIGKD